MSKSEDWSEFIHKMTAMSDEDLMDGMTTLIALSAKPEFSGSASKEHLPQLEKSAKLMRDEIKRRGLKHKDILV